VKGSSPLEAVREDPAGEDEGGWTVVQGKRGRRAGSLPCMEKASAEAFVKSEVAAPGERMDLEQ